MKKCPECKSSLSKIGFVELNFRHAIQGGNILKATTWVGGYQFFVLVIMFLVTAFIGEKNLELAVFGIFLPGMAIFLILVRAKYSLYKCVSCKKQYAGPRLAKYIHGDSTYI